MGTFKLALVAVALLAALAGCGKPVEPVTTAESTTEAVTTTEASKKLAQGSENGVAWRELDLEDEANREIFEWLSPRPRSGESGIEPKYEGPKDKETRLSDTKTLIERPRRGLCDILLRDETTGAEIMLIESNDDEGAEWYSPYIEKIIDERFFWFGGTGWEWIEPDGVYDTQRMLAMYVEPPERCFVLYAGEYDGVRYYSDEIYAEECGQLHVYPLKLENLNTATTLMTGENLLKDIPEADMGETYYYWTLLSEDARYFVVAEDAAVRIFDLQAKEFVCRVPVTVFSQSFHMRLRDEHTLYCYFDNEREVDRYALEITLP